MTAGMQNSDLIIERVVLPWVNDLSQWIWMENAHHDSVIFRPVIVFSLEMLRRSWCMRYVVIACRIDQNTLSICVNLVQRHWDKLMLLWRCSKIRKLIQLMIQVGIARPRCRSSSCRRIAREHGGVAYDHGRFLQWCKFQVLRQGRNFNEMSESLLA